MAKITLEVPDELSEQLTALGDRLPELLALSLQQPAVPAHFYRHILDFISTNPTLEQITDFKPTPEMQARLRLLLARSKAEALTAIEQAELDEYEHLIILLKSSHLRQRGSSNAPE